ncbi:MAG: carbohydrate ABC transporter permease [Chloroflexota bacterium]
MKASGKVQPSTALAIGRKSRARDAVGGVLLRLVLRVILIAGALTMVLPFIWMLSTSLKSLNDAITMPPQLMPNPITWSNYTDVFQQVTFGRFFLNTIIVAVGRTAGQVVMCSLAGYGFARMRFPGKNLLFMIYLAALMVPFQVIVIPEFILIKQLGWLDTYKALIVPGIFSAFGTFLLRQFFLTLPRSLEEAAIIDGCGLFGVLWRIVLPLSRPALSALVIFTFLWSWNDFLWPLVATKSNDMQVLSLGLLTLQGQYSTNWPYLSAGAVMASLPMLIIYIVLQKHFVQGIAMSGIKG